MRRTVTSEGVFAIRAMEDAPEDYALIARWLSNPRVLEFYEGRDHPFTLEMVFDDFNPKVMGEEGVAPCILEYEQKPVGYLQFYPVEEEGRQEYRWDREGITYGLDLFIGEPDYWNRGIGTALVRLLLSYLFTNRDADWVILDPHVDNARAIRTYEKCGFQKIKVLPRHEWHEGQYVDCWLMGVQKPI
jgi:aminoglycoside 6'-N-acetyltransferase